MKQRRSALEVLWDLNNRVEQAQLGLAEYGPGGGDITPEDAVGNVLGILEDPEFLEIQAEARGLLS